MFEFGASPGEKEALRILFIKISGNRALCGHEELLDPRVSRQSVEELLESVMSARTKQPRGSAFDPMLVGLQEACEAFRAYLAVNPHFPFGERLHALRLSAFELAQKASCKLSLPESEGLAGKIRLGTARSHLGTGGDRRSAVRLESERERADLLSSL